jgi:hypothetical protein
MIEVKTFTQVLQIFKTAKELDDLDRRVNDFLREKGIQKVVSVSDATTTDDKGATMGIIRVVAYEK